MLVHLRLTASSQRYGRIFREKALGLTSRFFCAFLTSECGGNSGVSSGSAFSRRLGAGVFWLLLAACFAGGMQGARAQSDLIGRISENIWDELTLAGTEIANPLNSGRLSSHTYALKDDSGLFGIDPSLGQLTVKVDTNFDYERGKRIYTLTVTETISGSRRERLLRIYLADMPEPPRLQPIADRKLVADGTFGMDIAYAEDPDIVEAEDMEKRKQLHSVSGLPPNFNYRRRDGKLSIFSYVGGPPWQPGTYTVTVKAVDDQDSSLSDEQTFVLDILAIGKIRTVGPTITLSHARQSDVLTVSIEEPLNSPVTLAVNNRSTGKVKISPGRLVFAPGNLSKAVKVSISSRALRQNENTRFTFELKVRNPAKGDPRYKKSSPLRVVGVFRANALPSFPPHRLTISENIYEGLSRAGMPIGAPLVATDSDGRDADLKYSIEDASGLFGIDGDSAQVTLSRQANFDHESADSYTVTVVATDIHQGRGTQPVEISVRDVNEPPRLPDFDNQRIAGRPGYAFVQFGDEPADWRNGSYKVMSQYIFDFDYAQNPEPVTNPGERERLHTVGGLPDNMAYRDLFGDKVIYNDQHKSWQPGVYTITIKAVDDQDAELFDEKSFVMEVFAAGTISASLQPEFNFNQRQAVFQARLSQPPDAPVTVAVASSAVGAAQPEGLAFTPENWNQPQPVTVSVSEQALAANQDAKFVVGLEIVEHALLDIRYRRAPRLDVAGTFKANWLPAFTVTVLNVPENIHNARTTVGTKIGTVLVATDRDGDDADLRYSLEDASGLFGIDEETAQVTLLADVNFNYEGKRKIYTVTVAATDIHQGRGTQAVEIRVTDVNEPPRLGEIRDEKIMSRDDFIYTFKDGESPGGLGPSYRRVIFYAQNPEVKTAEEQKRLHTITGLPENMDASYDTGPRWFLIQSDPSKPWQPGAYTVTVKAVDEQDASLSDQKTFVLEILSPGNISVEALPEFSHEMPSATTAVRISEPPDTPITIWVSHLGTIASARPNRFVFTSENWNQPQAVTVSVSRQMREANRDTKFEMQLFFLSRDNLDLRYWADPGLAVTVTGTFRANLLPTFTVTVLTVPENIHSAKTTVGTKIGTVLVATDRDGDDADLRYSLEDASGLFGIDEETAQVTLLADVNFNYEGERKIYAVTVAATDIHQGRGTQAVEIRVTDVNEPPRLGEIRDEKIMSREDFIYTFKTGESPGGAGNSYRRPIFYAQNPEVETAEEQKRLHTIAGLPENMYASYGTGPRWFLIQSNPSKPWQPGAYTVTVKAVDDQDASLSDQKTFVLEILSPGNISVEALPEFSQGMTSATTAVRISEPPDTPVTIRASHLGTIASARPIRFVFTSENWNQPQAMTVSVSRQMREANRDTKFKVRFFILSGNNLDLRYWASPPLRVTVAGTFQANLLPTFAVTVLTVPENIHDAKTEAGTKIGTVLVATDHDGNDADLRYSLEDASGLFGIDGKSGQVSLNTETNFNYEGERSVYTVTVAATDIYQGRGTQAVEIRVTDVNEPPRLREIPDEKIMARDDFIYTFKTGESPGGGRKQL